MESIMSTKDTEKQVKPPAQPAPQAPDTPAEIALDVANELSFPASDPVSASNITRIEKAPETAPAAAEHQNSNAIEATEQDAHPKR
jgi:hypothetical protein